MKEVELLNSLGKGIGSGWHLSQTGEREALQTAQENQNMPSLSLGRAAKLGLSLGSESTCKLCATVCSHRRGSCGQEELSVGTYGQILKPNS